MEEKKVIRAAIIGSGQIARTSHIPAYRSMENVEIVAVSDANGAAAQSLQRILIFLHIIRTAPECFGK